MVHSKCLDLKNIPKLCGSATLHTSTHLEADRPLSMAWTRITYRVPCLLLTLPEGFPEHFERTAGVQLTGPRLHPRNELWEAKAGPLPRLRSLAPLS